MFVTCLSKQQQGESLLEITFTDSRPAHHGGLPSPVNRQQHEENNDHNNILKMNKITYNWMPLDISKHS